ITPFQVFHTANGHMIVACGNDVMWKRFCEVIARPDLIENPRYASNRLRNEHHAELEEIIQSVLVTRTTEDWLALLDEAGVPASRINNVAQVMAHPQVGPRNMVVDVEDPKAGRLRIAGNPIKLSGVDDPPTRETAPDVDEDRETILRELAS